MSSTKKPTGKTQRSAIADVVAREYTIHMHKRVNQPNSAEFRISR
jgi:large subunit ribosomal protein L31e